MSNVASEPASVSNVKSSERIPNRNFFYILYPLFFNFDWWQVLYIGLLIYVDHRLTKVTVPGLFKGIFFIKLIVVGEGLWHCGECILERATRQILRSQGMPFFTVLVIRRYGNAVFRTGIRYGTYYGKGYHTRLIFYFIFLYKQLRLRIRVPAIFISELQDGNKTLFLFAYYFQKVHLHNFQS